MHKLNAVASATCSPRSITSRCVMAVNSSAPGFTRGSSANTPSTALAINTTSAPISNARCAAVVSVEKYGSPIPAPKITTRPFSRWRTARSGMYGSATCPMVIAVCTLVSMPSFSRKSCSARLFITVPSIPM